MDNSNEVGQTASAEVAHFIFGRFRFDVASRQLLRDGELVPLSAKGWDTLHLLITHRHRVVAKDELLGLIWPQKAVSEDLLPQNILAIRRALGDDSGQPRFIATTPRRGYRFIAPVTVVHAGAEKMDAPLTADPPLGADAAAAALPLPASAAPDLARPLPARPHQMLAWTLASLAVASLLLVVLFRAVSAPYSTIPGRQLRFTQSPPEGTTFMSGGVLSPDGRYVTFVARDEDTGTARLWLRALDTMEVRPVNGTEGASKPFWSPDSQSLAFFSAGRLKRIGLGGEPPQTIADVGLTPAGGSWNARGRILFAPWKSGISSVADIGGAVTVVTTLDASADDAAHEAPQFLPDGRHFLFFVRSSNPEKSGTYVGAIDSHDRVRLTDSPANYSSAGALLTTRDGALMAQPFDMARLRLVDRPTLVANGVQPGTFVSSAGADLLAFGGGSAGSRLVWYDRRGQTLSTIDSPARLHNLAFSPDLKQLIASSSDADQRGVWVIDLARGAPTRFTPYGSSPWSSPDGQRIVYTSDRQGGVADVYLKPTAGGAAEELVLRTPENKIVNDWSPDGRYIVYASTNPSTKKDLWLLPQFGARQPVPYLQTSFNEIQGQVSPDGRWMAYASDESGAWQVYVQSFPVPGRKRAISVAGGAQPRWRHDGRELFFLAPDHALMGVDVVLGESCEPGRPHALFKAPIVGALNTYRSHYAVTADGQRFLVDSADANQRSITLLVNWSVPPKR